MLAGKRFAKFHSAMLNLLLPVMPIEMKLERLC
jgi:hypothetical protein